jgi:hypothetical protein
VKIYKPLLRNPKFGTHCLKFSTSALNIAFGINHQLINLKIKISIINLLYAIGLEKWEESINFSEVV